MIVSFAEVFGWALALAIERGMPSERGENLEGYRTSRLVLLLCAPWVHVVCRAFSIPGLKGLNKSNKKTSFDNKNAQAEKTDYPLARNQYINNSPGIFPVFARVRIQVRHVFAPK